MRFPECLDTVLIWTELFLKKVFQSGTRWLDCNDHHWQIDTDNVFTALILTACTQSQSTLVVTGLYTSLVNAAHAVLHFDLTVTNLHRRVTKATVSVVTSITLISTWNSHSVVELSLYTAPQWGTADAEIKVPSGENTELKRSPFQAWSRSVYSLTCYTYCQGVLLCLFLPFQSIHLHFFQNLSQFFPVLACRIK